MWEQPLERQPSISVDRTAIWIYIAGPVAGAVLASFAYRFLRGSTTT